MNSHPKVVVVDLARFTETGARVFAGQRWGQCSREAARLDQHDRDPAVVVQVHVPRELIVLNSSFCRALFAPSIEFLKEEFTKKYTFVGEADHVQALRESVTEVVVDVLRGPTRLGIYGVQDDSSAGTAPLEM